MHQFIFLLLVTALSIITKSQCYDSESNQCLYCLSQNDFANGTYRAKYSGLYCLIEDIIFNPNPSTSNPNVKGAWFPTDDNEFPGCVDQANGGYALGFFAALTIEANDIILDLSGFTMSYSVEFYLQQRFGAIIEIANQPFLDSTGPAQFGSGFINVDNVTVKNGELGLSSHHGIHSNGASNVVISNLKIYDFEVGAIQLNGFHNVVIEDIDIGPSLKNVLLTGYYSNARFLVLAYRRLLDVIEERKLEMPAISFAYMEDEESVTLLQIYENLIESMDYVFRELVGDETLTTEDRTSASYVAGMDLFNNTERLPDGSAIYGIILNSFSVAVNGFGDSKNEDLHGENITINNVEIDDMVLLVNEIPAIYFDLCEDPESEDVNILMGPFGDVMDIGKMVNSEDRDLIDEYDVLNPDLSGIKYIGNPLADAQIALYLYGEYPNDGIDYAFGGFVSDYFLDWVLNDNNLNDTDNAFPTCAAFVCNGDVMFHTNKGVVGLRIDHIENTKINDINITNLHNKSPLASDTCSNYSGPHNGGIAGTTEQEGGMNTDLRGISISGGDVTLSGNNRIEDLYSYYGDVIAIHVQKDGILDFEYETGLSLVSDTFDSGTKLTQELYQILIEINKTPYPNNFELCTIKISDTSSIINPPRIGLAESDCTLPVFESLTSTTDVIANDKIKDEGKEESGVLGAGLEVDMAVFGTIAILIILLVLFVAIKLCKKDDKDGMKNTRKSMKPLQTDIDQDRGNIEIASSPSPDETTTLNPAEMSDHDLL